MQLTTLFALALASSSSFVLAANCKTGLVYCGRTLLTRGKRPPPSPNTSFHGTHTVPPFLRTLTIRSSCVGNYFAQIAAELRARGESTADNYINDSTFFCKGGSNGDIIWQHKCTDGRCVNNGDGNSDYCN